MADRPFARVEYFWESRESVYFCHMDGQICRAGHSCGACPAYLKTMEVVREKVARIRMGEMEKAKVRMRLARLERLKAKLEKEVAPVEHARGRRPRPYYLYADDHVGILCDGRSTSPLSRAIDRAFLHIPDEWGDSSWVSVKNTWKKRRLDLLVQRHEAWLQRPA